jgi:hypothetical protein
MLRPFFATSGPSGGTPPCRRPLAGTHCSPRDEVQASQRPTGLRGRTAGNSGLILNCLWAAARDQLCRADGPNRSDEPAEAAASSGDRVGDDPQADRGEQRGIRFNSVAPGPVWTPLMPSTMPAAKVESFGNNTPLGRPGQPVEVAPYLICWPLMRAVIYRVPE